MSSTIKICRSCGTPSGLTHRDNCKAHTGFVVAEECIELPAIDLGPPELPPVDMVNLPPHYGGRGVECIQAIEASLTPEEYRGYLKGNIMKYIWRERQKGKTESLLKAEWYLKRLLGSDC